MFVVHKMEGEALGKKKKKNQNQNNNQKKSTIQNK
jgi:hypothetical protein